MIVLMAMALVVVVGACGSQGIASTSSIVPKAASAGGVIEVTGFNKLTLDAGAVGPVTVLVKGQQADAIRSALRGLRSTSSGPLCMETVDAFKISFFTHQGGRPTSVATEQDCPTPGVAIVTVGGKAQRYLQEDCALRAAVISSLPKGQAEGTKRDKNICSV